VKPGYRSSRSRFPAIFQPEVAAEAIFYAAHHRRREMYVGRSTVKAIVANKVFPTILDRYLAKTGFRSQQTDKPVLPHRPSNLFHPLSGDPGAHGGFDNRAQSTSPQLWANTHRGWATLIGAALGAAAGTAVFKLRRS
jgi:hypothetical protein